MERLARNVDRFPGAQPPLGGAQAHRWRPAPFIAGSLGLHGMAVLGTIAMPAAWPWTLGAVAANQVAIAALGLWPRSTWLGRNLTHLPRESALRGEIALTIDDGPDPEVTPRVLDILHAHGCRATFFCIAERARAHPELCREIVRRGHGVENHSLVHSVPTFPCLTLGRLRSEVGGAQAALAEVTGRAPRFFRPPAGLRNPLLDPVLHEMGLVHVTWTRRGFDTKTRDPARVTARLLRNFAAGDILLLHDGHAQRTARGVPLVLEVLPRLVDAAREHALRPVALHEAIAP